MGLSNIFNPENGFFTFMGKAFDILVLNLVWILLYLPFGAFFYLFATTGYGLFLVPTVLSLVVFVPSMIAMYYAVVKSIRRSRSYPVKEFFRSFKANFRQGAVASFIFVFLGFLLFMDFQYSWDLINAGDGKGVILLGVFFVITLFVSGLLIFLCPVLSRFTMDLKGAFKFSFGISVKHFWCTILSFLLWFAIVVLIYLTMGFVLFFGIAAGTLVGSFMMEKVLRRYMEQAIEHQKQAEANGTEDGTEEKPEYTESFEDGGENSKKDEWYLE